MFISLLVNAPLLERKDITAIYHFQLERMHISTAERKDVEIASFLLDTYYCFIYLPEETKLVASNGDS